MKKQIKGGIMRVILLNIMILAILSACDFLRPTGPSMLQRDSGTPLPITPKVVCPDSNGNIDSKLGDTVEIKILNTSYDGGFLWKITAGFDTSIAKFESYKTEYTGSKKVDSLTGEPIIIVGAPTYQIWRYKTSMKGITSMEMKLYRPWEPLDIIGTKTYSLSVE